MGTLGEREPRDDRYSSYSAAFSIWMVLGRSYALRSLRNMDERRRWAALTARSVLEALQYNYELTSPLDDRQLLARLVAILVAAPPRPRNACHRERDQWARDLAVAIATDLAVDVGLQRSRPYSGWPHNEPPPPTWL